MLLIEAFAPDGAVACERLLLPFESRCKSRLRARLASGEEAGLFLERGRVLRDGDRLLGNDGRVVEVVAAPEMLMEAASDDPLQLARCLPSGQPSCRRAGPGGPPAFRARPCIGRDGPRPRPAGYPKEAPFEPEAGAYGGGHGPRLKANWPASGRRFTITFCHDERRPQGRPGLAAQPEPEGAAANRRHPPGLPYARSQRYALGGGPEGRDETSRDGLRQVAPQGGAAGTRMVASREPQ